MNGYEKRTQEKKDKVMEATFDLINTEDGISNLTMEEVALKANVAKTSIFKYFGSKENLIKEVFTHFINQMMDEIREIVSENKPFEETIIAISLNKIKYLNKINNQFYLDLMNYFTEKNDDGFSILMQKYMEESVGIMMDLFHRGRKDGKIDLKYSDEFLLLYMQALVEGVSNPQVYERIHPYTAEWTEVFLKGIAPNKH